MKPVQSCHDNNQDGDDDNQNNPAVTSRAYSELLVCRVDVTNAPFGCLTSPPCTIQYALCTMHNLLSNMHCAPCTIYLSLSTMHYALSNMHMCTICIIFTMHYILCTMHCALSYTHHALCTIFYAPCTVHYLICAMHYILCTLHGSLTALT